MGCNYLEFDYKLQKSTLLLALADWLEKKKAKQDRQISGS